MYPVSCIVAFLDYVPCRYQPGSRTTHAHPAMLAQHFSFPACKKVGIVTLRDQLLTSLYGLKILRACFTLCNHADYKTSSSPQPSRACHSLTFLIGLFSIKFLYNVFQFEDSHTQCNTSAAFNVASAFHLVYFRPSDPSLFVPGIRGCSSRVLSRAFEIRISSAKFSQR